MHVVVIAPLTYDITYDITGDITSDITGDIRLLQLQIPNCATVQHRHARLRSYAVTQLL